MPKAFVLINVESGTEEQVLRDLKGVEGIEEAYYSYGVYDIITKIQAATMESLKDTVTRNIRTLPNVRSTLTLIIVDTD
jgi:DNA-binding Lrp family transcriptional regulator